MITCELRFFSQTKHGRIAENWFPTSGVEIDLLCVSPMRVWYLASDVTSTYLPTMQLLGVSHQLVLSYEVRPSAVEIIGQISKKVTNIKAITFAMEIRLIPLYGSTYKR